MFAKPNNLLRRIRTHKNQRILQNASPIQTALPAPKRRLTFTICALLAFMLVFLGILTTLYDDVGATITRDNADINVAKSTVTIWDQEVRQTFFTFERNFASMHLFPTITLPSRENDPRYDIRITHLTDDNIIYQGVWFASDMIDGLELTLLNPEFETAYSPLTLIITPLAPFPTAPALTLSVWEHAENQAVLTLDGNTWVSHSLEMEWAHRRSQKALWGLLLATAVAVALCILYITYPRHAPKAMPSHERTFAIMACTTGLVLCFANPMFAAYDECVHFTRAYNIAQGHPIIQQVDGNYGMMMPEQLYDYTMRRYHFRELALDRAMLLSEKQNSTMVFSDFVTHTRTYSPINYLPQAIGILFGKLFHTNILMQAYISRIMALWAYVSLTILAIHIIPYRKSTLMALALLPMLVMTASSISQDAVMIGGIFLFTAQALRALLPKNTIPTQKENTIRPLVFLALTTLLFIPSKYVYAPFLLLAFLIPARNFHTPRQKHIFRASLTIIILLSAVWTIWTTLQTNAPASEAAFNGSLQELLTHPWIFLFSAVRTVFLNLGEWLTGWNDQPWLWGHESIATIITPAILLATTLTTPSHLQKRHSRWMYAAFAATVLLVLLAGYLIWNDPNTSYYIGGIQGRYFLPALPLLLLTFPQGNEKKELPPETPNSTSANPIHMQTTALACLMLLMLNLMYGIITMY